MHACVYTDLLGSFLLKQKKKIAQFKILDFKEGGRQKERGRSLLSKGFRTRKGHVCLQSVFIVNVHLAEAMHLRICCL